MSPIRTRCPGAWSSWFPPGIRRLIVFAITNTSGRIFIAYASTGETGPGGSPGPAARRGGSRQARPGGVGGSAQGPRDADAPAANRPVEQDRHGLERLRRRLAAGAGRRPAADDGPPRPRVFGTVWADAPHRPAGRRGTG